MNRSDGHPIAAANSFGVWECGESVEGMEGMEDCPRWAKGASTWTRMAIRENPDTLAISTVVWGGCRYLVIGVVGEIRDG